MEGSASSIADVLAIHLLDVMTANADDFTKCRLAVLDTKDGPILIEPVLDYLSDDTVILGVSVNQAGDHGSEKLLDMLVERQKSAGYQSNVWKWETHALVDKTQVEVFIGHKEKVDCSIAIVSKSGNLEIEGLQKRCL